MSTLFCATFPTVILTCVPFTTIAHPSWDAPTAYWSLCPVSQSWTSLCIAQACRCRMSISRAAAAFQRTLCQGVLSDSWILHSEHCYVLQRWRNWASEKSRDSPDHRLQVRTARLEPRKPCLGIYHCLFMSWCQVSAGLQCILNNYWLYFFWKYKLRDRW